MNLRVTKRLAPDAGQTPWHHEYRQTGPPICNCRPRPSAECPQMRSELGVTSMR